MTAAAWWWILGGAVLGGTIFRLRGWRGFEEAVGRGATTARLVWGVIMGLFAWAAWATPPVAAALALGLFLGAMEGWKRSLSLGRYEADRPAFGAVMRHAARGIVFPMFAADLMLIAGWWFGQNVDRQALLIAASGLVCVPAYEIGWRLRPMGDERWPGATEIGEILFGASMGASIGAGAAMRVLAGAAVLLVVLASPATAHQAPAGWDYDPECCHNIDCAPVPDGTVREVQGGYEVVLRPGQHPMLRGSVEVQIFIPHGDRRIRVSGDSDRHVCVSGYGTVFCIYIPPGGV